MVIVSNTAKYRLIRQFAISIVLTLTSAYKKYDQRTVNGYMSSGCIQYNCQYINGILSLSIHDAKSIVLMSALQWYNDAISTASNSTSDQTTSGAGSQSLLLIPLTPTFCRQHVAIFDPHYHTQLDKEVRQKALP